MQTRSSLRRAQPSGCAKRTQPEVSARCARRGGPATHAPRKALCLALALALLPALANGECLLSVVNVSFGAYDTLSLADSEITGGVVVTCDIDSIGEVTLSTGFGSFTERRMQSGANLLFYNLFLDPARLTIWGDGSPGTSLLSFNGTGSTYPVYGRIPARQNVPVGEYTDTITVTLTF
jgi:spore coat protein U-like protein